jgi:mttA/Hcf106 family
MTGLTQPSHIVLILVIALPLFGGRRLPEIGRLISPKLPAADELDRAAAEIGAAA